MEVYVIEARPTVLVSLEPISGEAIPILTADSMRIQHELGYRDGDPVRRSQHLLEDVAKPLRAVVLRICRQAVRELKRVDQRPITSELEISKWLAGQSDEVLLTLFEVCVDRTTLDLRPPNPGPRLRPVRVRSRILGLRWREGAR
jgi:hypothetical protein